jgi:hypothetical protein
MIFLFHCIFYSTGFLPSTHPSDHLYVRSTDVNRCLISVTELLKTFYPSDSIPIHTIPEESDRLLQPTDKCMSYVLNYPTIIHSMETTSNQLFTSNMIETMKQAAGWKDIKTSNLITITHDNLICQKGKQIIINSYIYI